MKSIHFLPILSTWPVARVLTTAWVAGCLLVCSGCLNQDFERESVARYRSTAATTFAGFDPQALDATEFGTTTPAKSQPRFDLPRDGTTIPSGGFTYPGPSGGFTAPGPMRGRGRFTGPGSFSFPVNPGRGGFTSPQGQRGFTFPAGRASGRGSRFTWPQANEGTGSGNRFTLPEDASGNGGSQFTWPQRGPTRFTSPRK